jgi:phenylacetic acid degradation operon negative regulatory protein
VGRRSRYETTAAGRHAFRDDAHRRIYAAALPPWSGRWHLLLSGNMPRERREALRRNLLWLGFGCVGPRLYAHPRADLAELRSMIERLALRDQVLVFDAAAAEAPDLLRQGWNLDALAGAYRRFLATFGPVQHAAERDRAADPGAAFVLRALLIHEYRRIVLRDPQLPPQLLPANWSGDAARQLCRSVYAALLDGSQQHIGALLDDANSPAPYFFERFGGLR